jgi:hypothetical protein
VKLEGVELDQFEERLRIAHHQVVRVFSGLLPDGNRVDPRETGSGMLLEEAGLVDTLGAADDRDGPVDDLGQQPGHHGDVVVGDVAFGDAPVGEDDPLRMREPHLFAGLSVRCCLPGARLLRRRACGALCRRSCGALFDGVRFPIPSPVRIQEVLDPLVHPDRLQRRLAQQALLADAAIESLHHDGRLDPAGAAQVGIVRRHVDRRRRPGVVVQLPQQFGELAVGEAGAEPAGIAPAVFRIRPRQQQGTESGPGAFGRREAHHGELVAGRFLALEPVVAPAAAMGRIGALRDDALETLGSRRLEHLLSSPDHV